MVDNRKSVDHSQRERTLWRDSVPVDAIERQWLAKNRDISRYPYKVKHNFYALHRLFIDVQHTGDSTYISLRSSISLEHVGAQDLNLKEARFDESIVAPENLVPQEMVLVYQKAHGKWLQIWAGKCHFTSLVTTRQAIARGRPNWPPIAHGTSIFTASERQLMIYIYTIRLNIRDFQTSTAMRV